MSNFGFGDLGKLSGLLKNAGKIQEMMKASQEALAQKEVDGASGGDLVKVKMTGRYYVSSIEISDEAMSEGKDVVSELVMAAINDATEKVEALTKDSMMDMANIFSTGDL